MRSFAFRLGLALGVLAVGCATPAPKEAARTAVAPAQQAVSRPVGAPEDTFYSETAGFGLVKPAGWLFATLEWEEANRERVSLGNKDFDEGVRKHASAPLVLVVKHPEPYDKVNPTVRVIVRPLGQLEGASAREIADVSLAGMKQALPGMVVDGPIEETSLSGLPAAYFRLRMSIRAGEPAVDYPVLSRMWLVPRGRYVFLIGMSGSPDGDEVSESEFAYVLKTIQVRQ